MSDQIIVRICSVWGTDRDMANQAWASTYDADRLAERTDADVARVVSDIITKQHGSPQARIMLDVFLRVPIFIERQLDKYRMTVQYQGVDADVFEAPFGRHGITQNELSGRYRSLPERWLALPDDVAGILRKVGIRDRYTMAMVMAFETYQASLADLKEARDGGGISGAEYKRAREILRGVLGTSMLTDMRIVCSLQSLAWIIDQRIAPDAQVESQQVARMLVDELRKVDDIRVTVDALIASHGWRGTDA